MLGQNQDGNASGVVKETDYLGQTQLEWIAPLKLGFEIVDEVSEPTVIETLSIAFGSSLVVGQAVWSQTRVTVGRLAKSDGETAEFLEKRGRTRLQLGLGHGVDKEERMATLLLLYTSAERLRVKPSWPKKRREKALEGLTACSLR